MGTIQVGNKHCEYHIFREWNNLKVIEMEDLPINGCSCQWNDSGEYRIFINRDLPDPEKLRTFVHEMIHLFYDDHNNKDMDLQEIEDRAHRITEDILKGIG